MPPPDDDFLQSLRATFKVEAAEHLQAITTGLLELENLTAPAAQAEQIATVFRAAHSLKGAARAVDLFEIESLCQSLEDMFAQWKRPGGTPSLAVLDGAHHTLDAITAALSPAATPLVAAPPPFRAPVAPSVADDPLTPLLPPAAEPPPVATAETTVRISVGKLDARLMEAEEMLMAKLTTGQRAEDLRELAQRFEAWRHEWAAVEPMARSLRQAADRAGGATPGLARLLEFVDWNADQLKLLESQVATLTRTAEQDRYVIGKLVDDLLEDSKKLLLLPFATLAAPFPKLVRDLCRDQGKEADFVMQGEHVEIDKRILEEMKDPLTHILRNCVDHGIEAPDRRASLGKPPRATLTLAVSQVDGRKVELLVSDDGAGIDTARVKESAIKHGLLSPEESRAMSEDAARALIFQAEVSTSPMITRLSGRGLGLSIVRERAEKLGGSVAVESRPGHGTRFRIVLPLMRSTFRGILIEVEKRSFVVPTAQVERVARVPLADVRTVEGRETITLHGRALSFVRLGAVLELPPAEGASPTPAMTPILLLSLGEQRIAFAIDAVLGEQEVLVKPLQKPLARVRHIAGATVLGSGQVVPVLHVADLLKSARKSGAAVPRTVAAAAPKVAQNRSVLVAEDSITSRMLIKAILESAGFKVKTAVDGLEAFTLLRAEKFDLVVSDVEMPRLNGFDLTARIRADAKLAELPVVLVTALETREDRERGVDVGASAYIVKSRFDQSDLLDAIRRLI